MTTDPREAATILYRHMLAAHSARRGEPDRDTKRYLWGLSLELATRLRFTVETGVQPEWAPAVDTLRSRSELEREEEADWSQQPVGSRRPKRGFLDVRRVVSRWMGV